MQLLFSFDQDTRVDETLMQTLACQLNSLPLPLFRHDEGYKDDERSQGRNTLDEEVRGRCENLDQTCPQKTEESHCNKKYQHLNIDVLSEDLKVMKLTLGRKPTLQQAGLCGLESELWPFLLVDRLSKYIIHQNFVYVLLVCS